ENLGRGEPADSVDGSNVGNVLGSLPVGDSSPRPGSSQPAIEGDGGTGSERGAVVEGIENGRGESPGDGENSAGSGETEADPRTPSANLDDPARCLPSKGGASSGPSATSQRPAINLHGAHWQ